MERELELARQVGGDFCLAIADVTDKGMPASVYMALTRRLTYARAGHDRPFLLGRRGTRGLDGIGMPPGLLPAEQYYD